MDACALSAITKREVSMNPNLNVFRETKKELGDVLREVSTWRDRYQTVLGLVHDAETDGERAAAATLARRLQDHMVTSGRRIHAFSRRLGELAEQLDSQAARPSDVHTENNKQEE